MLYWSGMNKTTSLTLVGLGLIIGVFGTINYHLLLSQNLAATIGGPVIATPINAAVSSASNGAFSASPSPTPDNTCSINQYKLLQNVDACTLTTLAKKGWTVFQAGTVFSQNGKDTDCNTYSPNNIDSVVLVKASPSHTCF